MTKNSKRPTDEGLGSEAEDCEFLFSSAMCIAKFKH